MLLYAVTDRSWLNGRTVADQVKDALEGGATFIQLREKELDYDAFLAEAIEIKALCDKYGVPFVINDNVDIALACGADGVHVGQSDMEAGDVRAKLGDDKIIGVCVHSVEAVSYTHLDVYKRQLHNCKGHIEHSKQIFSS